MFANHSNEFENKSKKTERNKYLTNILCLGVKIKQTTVEYLIID